MIIPEKTYTSNPFVDNTLYYAKILALNSVIKDEDQALKYETKESLSSGDILIACTESRATYEIFPMIPKEILEKYIQSKSNLDLYVESVDALNTHLLSYPQYQKTNIFNQMCNLARTIYIDHYDIMMHYLSHTSCTWLEDNKALYDRCVAKTTTYRDLFDNLPKGTVKRIVKQYLNNYNSAELAEIIETLDSFQDYIDARTDSSIQVELINISNAMRCVFISHYDMMVKRGYLAQEHSNWLEYTILEAVFNRCKANASSYSELYDLFPVDDLTESLYHAIGETTTESFRLYDGLDILEEYFNSYSLDAANEKASLTAYMTKKYLDNYNPMINKEIYDKCKNKEIDYWELIDYMPKETVKIIINTFIDEVSNIDVYEKSKNMLNEFLASINKEKRDEIKASILKDMMEWYPKNYVELNPYYRALIGLPPMNDKGLVFTDTLKKTYCSTSNSYIDFGDYFIEMIPNNAYPPSHWEQPICDLDNYDIAILEEYGILQQYVEMCKSRNVNDILGRYDYFRFLGDNRLDPYICRKASKYQLMSVPAIDDVDAKKKFVDAYAINRDYVIRTVYAEGYKFASEYYDKFMIIFIILNTMCDMLVGIPENIIDREVFDARCIKYIFESYGIPYYSEIPIKYQRAMLKNLNTLIKFKSSTRNMIDICSLFGFDDVKVFNYYLFKSKKSTLDTGEYLFDENNDITYDLDALYIMEENGNYEDFNGVRYAKLTDYGKFDPAIHTKMITVKNDDGTTTQKQIMNNNIVYYVIDPDDSENFIPIKDLDYFTKIKANTKAAELKFIRVPVGESVTEYKNDPNYISEYDEIVDADQGDTWDGGLQHEELKQKIIDYEFNAVRTKYISIETVTEMTELAFQVSYFYNMLFDNFYSEDGLTVEIPYIKVGHKFRFMDVVCYLFALMYMYNNLEDNIMYSPTQILYVKGYNFNESFNEVLKDGRFFNQTDEDGEEIPDYKKTNIFSINDRIAEDNYSYQEAFKNFKISAFNLGADIDELERWLNDACQMSLDDFVVDDSLEKFNQVITFRSFFSLNNSYYQKDIFKQNLLPLAYNQIIKYAFDYDLYTKNLIKDIEAVTHEFVTVDGRTYEMINDTSESICVMDYEQFLFYQGKKIQPYYQYTRQDDGSYVMSLSHPFVLDSNGVYKRLFDKKVNIVRNSAQKCIFAADVFYRKVNDIMQEITDYKYYMDDPYEPGKKILLFGEYYTFENDKWQLNPENCYVMVVKNGTVSYILYKDIDQIKDLVMTEDQCFVRRPNGSFVRLSDTDYYIRTHNKKTDCTIEFMHYEEECFVIADRETEWFDPKANPRVYYMKLGDYYSENKNLVITAEFFVKDRFGNYVPEKDLIHPTNFYYIDPETGTYALVIEHMAIYRDYTEPFMQDGIMVLKYSNDYSVLIKGDSYRTYLLTVDPIKTFVYNSDIKYALALIKNATYDKTLSFIIVFNRYLDAKTQSDKIYDDDDRKYNPEATDKVWDENDYIYTAPSSDPENPLKMNGENKWYYNGLSDGFDEVNPDINLVGAGFYLEASSYVGDIEFEQGARYYMSFDVETNFGGRIQISNEADADCLKETDREYTVYKGTKTHVNQVFKANAVKHPTVRFLIYCYDELPIRVGDYIVVKNFRITKSKSDNFIPQDIPSFDKLQELYRTNEAIYKYLIKMMAECCDYRMYKIYEKLYESLMTSEYNKEAFKIGENKYAKTYTDFLETRDAVLYERLKYIKTLDIETMHKEIADSIVEITYAIDGCVDTYSYGYLYSYFPAVSVNFIQQYISKVINFFKSWKVHLLGINTVYKFNSVLDNSVKVLGKPEYQILLDDTMHEVFVQDVVKINPIDALSPSGVPYPEVIPDMVKYSHYVGDDCKPRDRVRVISRFENRIRITDNYENMHIIFGNDEIEVKEQDGELIIKSESAGFVEANENELHMITDETLDQAFASQVIGEINHFSKDIFEWRDYKDER